MVEHDAMMQQQFKRRQKCHKSRTTPERLAIARDYQTSVRPSLSALCSYFVINTLDGFKMASKALAHFAIYPRHRMHFIFGANTDVGKSIVRVSANLPAPKLNCQTLFSWNTPASPHLASRWENLPVSNNEVITALSASLGDIIDYDASTENQPSESITTTTIVETAGGALSPSSSSPLNELTLGSHWGWSTQADLYSSFNIPVVFVGDAKLGGISVTLSSLEALWNRGYNVDAVVFIDGESSEQGECNGVSDAVRFGEGNAEALREYVMMQRSKQEKIGGKSIPYIAEDAIVLLPSLPAMPIPLDEWYERNSESFMNIHHLLNEKWCTYFS
ncbi:hypothetical protein HJC23_002301 [Cyclotella cryptica]|uniref:Uncharacterized protein n=1 Tax=Cyclotella cryptica TaxID=29204 RepID=A0ABD3QKI4_9STRA